MQATALRYTLKQTEHDGNDEHDIYIDVDARMMTAMMMAAVLMMMTMMMTTLEYQHG